jgi:hypothetical protein
LPEARIQPRKKNAASLNWPAALSPDAILPYCPIAAPATFSTATFRKYSAAASGKTELMNIPDPNSNPATRVRRGITLTYQ